MCNFILVKPGLHIVVTIAKHACDSVLKRVSKLSAYRLQVFLVKYEYLQSLQLSEDKGIRGKLRVTGDSWLIHAFAYSLFISLCSVMYQSIPSLTIPPPPGKTSGQFF